MSSKAERPSTIDRLTLVGVLVSTLAFSTAYGILLVLPLYITQELGGTAADYGAVASSATITAILCIALLIRFPSRFPPNHLLAAAAVVYAVGAFGVAQLGSYGLAMVACGLLLGTSWAIGYTTAPMVVSALCDDTSRGKYIGYATGMIQTGFGLGPVLVSVVRPAGLSFPDCFRAAGALAVVAAVSAGVLHLRSRELASVPAGDPDGAVPVSRVLRRVWRSAAVVPLGIILLCGCVFTTMNSFQTTLAENRGLTYSVFYVSYTVAVIVARFAVAPRLRDAASTGVVAVASIGVALSIAAFLVVGNDVIYGVAAAVLGVTYGLTLPGVQAGAVNASDESVRSRILPLAGMVFQVGILLFPLLAGVVITAAGYTALLMVLVCFGAAIASFGGSQWLIERRRVTGAADRVGRIDA
jgi:MFS family permease